MQDTERSVIDTEHIGQLMLKLAVPAFLGMVTITLYNVIDTIFIGRYVGPLGIAGLSIVFPLQMLSFGIGQMTGMGAASNISRLIGAGNKEKAEHVLGNAISATIVLNLILSVVGLADADYWLSLIGASESILPYARDYFTIVFLGIVFQTLSFTLNITITAQGNARVSMIGMMLGAVCNIILCAIFIIPLHMGVKGSAVAAVLSQIISCTYLLRYYYSRESYLKVHLKNLVPQLSILAAIFSIGISAFAMSLTSSFTAILVNRAFLAYGGDMGVSAFGIINRIMMFAMMPGMVVGQSMQPILGFNYGAKRYDMALRVIKLALIATACLSFAAFCLLYFAPAPLVRIFTDDAQLISQGVYYAKRIFLVLYIVGPSITGAVAFQAIGKPAQAFVGTVSRSFLFLMPMVLILPQFLELDGVLLAFPISDVLAMLLTFSMFIPQVMWFRRQASSARLQQGEKTEQFAGPRF